MAQVTNFIAPPPLPPPKRPRDLTVIWDVVAAIGCVLLTVAGWLVDAALGLAVLGVAVLIAGVMGGKAAGRVRVERAERAKVEGEATCEPR